MGACLVTDHRYLTNFPGEHVTFVGGGDLTPGVGVSADNGTDGAMWVCHT